MAAISTFCSSVSRQSYILPVAFLYLAHLANGRVILRENNLTSPGALNLDVENQDVHTTAGVSSLFSPASAGISSLSSLQEDYCTMDYSTMSDLDTPEAIPKNCRNYAIMSALATIMERSLDRYSDLIDDGYDAKYDTYNHYIRSIVPEELETYVSDHADDYFTCEEKVTRRCCHEMHYMVGTCDNSPKCKSGEQWVSKSACPTRFPGSSNHLYEDPGVWRWSVKDEDAFFDAIESDLGISRTWVSFQDISAWSNPGCHFETKKQLRECKSFWYGYPAPTDFNVPNPKDALKNSVGKFRRISDELSEAAMAARYNLYIGDKADVVDAVMLPAFMVQQADKSMAKIVQKANDIEEAEKKELIVDFIMSILMIVPAVGEAAEVLGMVTLGRLITMAGYGGNAAADIYGTVQDPKNAIFALFTALLGSRGSSEINFSKAAKIRRTMGSEDMSKLGPAIKADVGKVNQLKVPCI
jgi:chitinase